MAEKEVNITKVGNACMLYLKVFRDESNIGENHGPPTAVLDTATNADLGAAVRKALATRVRTKKEKAEASD